MEEEWAAAGLGPAERCAGWRGRARRGGPPEGDRVGRGTPGGASTGCPWAHSEAELVAVLGVSKGLGRVTAMD